MELQSRSAFRGQVTKLANSAIEFLASAESQPIAGNEEKRREIEEEISVYVHRISAAWENLCKANLEVRNVQNLKSEDLQKELETCCEYEDKAVGTIARLNHRLKKLHESQGGVVHHETSNIIDNNVNSLRNIKLPKMELRKFNGDYREWLPFWEQFRTAVHENSNLSGSDKFNYLLTVLAGKVKETVSGFTPTQNCYDAAISLLQEEYGDTERIIDRNMQNLMSLSNINSKSDITGLRRIYNTVISITRTLTSLGVPSSHYYVMLKTVLLKCMPIELRIEFHRSYAGDDGIDFDKSEAGTGVSDAGSVTLKGDRQVKMLLKFLKKEIESLERSNIPSRSNNELTKVTHTAASLLSAEKDNKFSCFFCNSENHSTKKCNSGHTIEQRKHMLKSDHRCLRCTLKGHHSKNCRTNNVKCAHCNGRHVSSMCEKEGHSSVQKRNPTIQMQARDQNKNVEKSASACSLSTPTRVYLQTARAFILNSNTSTKIFVRLLIDSGSQRTYIKQSTSRKLNLPVVGEQKIKISTFGGRKPEQSCNLVRLSVRSQFTNEVVSMIALEVEEICDDILIEPNPADVRDLKLILADSNKGSIPQEPGISLLVGSDYYWNIVLDKREHLSHNLAAVKTVLGWTLQGPSSVCFAGKSTCLPTISLLNLSNIEPNVSKFWDLETIGIANEERTNVNTSTTFDEYVVRKENYYEAKLLWRNGDAIIDSYKEGAQSRFGSLIRKLLRNPAELYSYEREMNALIANGIVEQVDANNEPNKRIYYLPHRAVYRDDKSTSKIRIVFDASAHSGNNASLNDLLSPGPNFLPNVLIILLNFRVQSVGLVADISKAFLQIHLCKRDRDVHRFFWFDGKIHDLCKLPNWTEFRMTRVTFGVACSPFLLNVTIQNHLKEERRDYPVTCGILENSFYMDDLVCSVSDELTAAQVYKESVDIMGRAGMILHKWNSNVPTVRETFSKSEFIPSMQKVLGLNWFVHSDELGIDMTHLTTDALPQSGTKRELLSLISRFFDPLGTCGPFTVRLKIAFQECWKQNLNWDDNLPTALQKTWSESVLELHYLKEVIIPRHIFTYPPTEKELHVFVDASPRAYGAVAYIRYLRSDGHVSVSYLCSKNRIAPLSEDKSPELTLPKLELTAAVIGTRLFAYLKDNLKVNFKSNYIWSDSQIALHWINGDHSKWKPYVSNRVREIQNKSKGAVWRFCTGKHNPADILTRGISAKKLCETKSWLQGPEWLQSSKEANSSIPIKVTNDDIQLINCFLLISDQRRCEKVDMKGEPILPIEKFSSLQKILRVTAYVLWFIKAAKENREKTHLEARGKSQFPTDLPIPRAEDIKAAELYWIKLYQTVSFGSELQKLHKGLALDSSSDIYDLNPIVAEDGTLRLGSRLSELKLVSYDESFPIILPRNCRLSELIIIDLHHKRLHAGVSTLMAELRKRFWIPRARQLIKQLTKSCVTCKKLRGKAISQVIGPLPKRRICSSRPFESTGIDFAGPLHVKQPQGNTKYYILLFTCSAIRAIHLELTPNLTTESCLRAIRRFMARRGVPETFMSDNAKTFKSSSSELSNLGEILQSSELKHFLAERKISWYFIVERAPWWGGFWERLIRSVKDALKAAVGRAALDEEQLYTFLTEVEDVVNSRPLTYISDDAKDLSPLTPAHFLKGFCANFDFENINLISDKDLRNRWTSRVRATRLFWKRWKLEYLNQLRSAHFSKNGSSYNVKENDVVLVYDQYISRLLWKLAIVQKTFPGRDGKVRACELRLLGGSCVRRPVQLLYPLEVSGPEDVEIGNTTQQH